ncbi:alpha/beta fold hydrolase [Sphingobium nicotianae]|uniref:Alpha/beta hydrolase n=1 Tax=Sphingobium nicotianae TaxID=2782607 RepID=A0A9X1DBB0_9SPHN|nr:alpha/beta hydrolase [Sphingobium nicotianae]MBT2186787.1 alpha/beta hydrolase [Sphingobium nicotianae]
MRPAPAYEPYRFASASDGLSLFARIYPGDGHPLLLMHGLTRNSADFEPLARHLAGRYRLIVPDQRGRGLSDPDPDPSHYRPDIYSADMISLLDGLGIDRVGLIGTSMGGLMAMIMANMQPERIAAIILNDIGAALDPAGLARIQGYVGPSAAFGSWEAAAARCARINAGAFPDFGLEDWLAFAHRTCREDGAGRIRFAYDPAIAQSIGGEEPATVPPDLWPLWDGLAVKPVLVLRGALSDLLAAQTVIGMDERHSGPFAAVEVPGRGHAPLLDEPEAREAIDAFLQAHLG